MITMICSFYRLVFGLVPLDCTVLLAGYRAADVEASLRFLNRLRGNVRLGAIYFIANSQEAAQAFAADGQGHLIRGSNEDGEWSAYQEGLDAAQAEGQLGKGVLILNDTVITHRHFSVFRFLAWLQRLRRGGASVLIGDVDRFKGKDFAIQGYPVSSWVSSYLMYLGPDLLRALGERVMVGKDLVDDWYATASVEHFFPDWLNADLHSHLEHWMFGGGWYGSQPLSAANLAKFRFKAKAIFYEKALSGASATLGTLVPVMPHRSLVQRVDLVVSRLRKSKPGAILAPLFIR